MKSLKSIKKKKLPAICFEAAEILMTRGFAIIDAALATTITDQSRKALTEGVCLIDHAESLALDYQNKLGTTVFSDQVLRIA